MVQILPFQGLRYQLEANSTLSDVTAPPYDVIEASEQQALYDRHPANVVRLILNQKTSDDSDTDNPYSRASWYLRDWIRTGVMALDKQPAIYAYSQQWNDAKQGMVERKGLIALVKLEEFSSGKILPHEHTLGGPKQDRFRLMQATLTNLSQIFMVYEDTTRWVESKLFEQLQADAWQEAIDSHGVAHKIQPMTDTVLIDRVQQLFTTQSLLIADGHHRYETALTFKQAVRQQLKEQNQPVPPDGCLPSDYVMVYLSNLHDPGLQVYPTHRLLRRWWPLEQSVFEQALQEQFTIVSESEATLTYRTVDKVWPLQVKASTDLSRIPAVMRHLDVALLDHVVFDGILKQSANTLKEEGVLRFYREDDAPSRLLASGEAICAFVMDTPKILDIKKVCEAGYRMPQKSTYFYPKILSGLVLYPYFEIQTDQFSIQHVQEAQALPFDLFPTPGMLAGVNH